MACLAVLWRKTATRVASSRALLARGLLWDPERRNEWKQKGAEHKQGEFGRGLEVAQKHGLRMRDNGEAPDRFIAVWAF